MAAMAASRGALSFFRSSYQLRTSSRSFQGHHPIAIVSTRLYADSAAAPPKDGENDIVKRIFFNLTSKLRAYMAELVKIRIVLDPDDPKVVADYASNMKAIRKKVGAYSPLEKMAKRIEEEAQSAPNVRSFMLTLRKLRSEFGVKDDLGADELMLEAVTKVEKKIGKTLTRDNAKGIALLKAEFDAINKKLGISHDSLGKLESEVELAAAKAQLEEMKNAVVETIETYKKRDGLEEIQVDIKSLDPRPYL